MTGSEEKYDALAEGFSEREYADPVRYSAGRARVIVELGPRLERGATVVDLGCGDAIMADPLRAYGLTYVGVDSSSRMIEVAQRLHPGCSFVEARFEDYRPAEPVETAICLRAFYQPADRVGFFRGVAGYVTQKFVFDFRQPAHAADTVELDLRTAGFTRIEMRPYFVPQRRAVPARAASTLEALGRTGPVGLFLSRYTGRVFCSASV